MEIAKNFIAYHRHFNLLKNQEAVNYVVDFIMRADSKFDGRGSRIGYLSANAKFGILSYYKDMKNRKSHISIDTAFKATEGSVNHEFREKISLRDHSEIIEAIDYIETKLKFLNPTQRTCIVEKYLNGLTLEEVGSLFDPPITAPAVLFHIRKALDILKKEYKV